MKTSLLLLMLAGLLLVVSSCTQSQLPEVSPPQEKGSFRIEVSRRGFDSTAGEYRLEVEEGQQVEITFVYGDKDFSQNNPHIIAIPDLGITTDPIDQQNPEATVHFTAGNTGEVAFVCTKVDCVGHTNLLGGILVVEEEGHGHEEDEQHN